MKDIHFSYGSREILRGISFDAEDNSIISILGSNGAGKTTLLKCLCRIHNPNSGSVIIGENNVTGLNGRELAKNIGFVPQSVPVSRMTVFDSVLIGRRPYIELSATRSDIEKTSAVIDALGLSHLSLRYMDEISGGEFQKVQIARALVQEPKVLILDEPTNNLDITNQHVTMHMVEDAVRSRGMCTIMTMHDINLAIHYSDKFLFLSGGEVAAYGGMDVIDEELIKKVYGIDADVLRHRGVPFVVPRDSSKYERVLDHAHPHDHTHPHTHPYDYPH
ncbi:MAG: ABC transporter ATP-binding protein [Candidatus Methanomethylophilaceae archaeon]|nr:ABC transporter ATP-binding protein [Candidatus Methanomethylophilaceae archaeon]